MPRKAIIAEFLVPTALAVALGILLSIGAVDLMNRYLSPADRPETTA
jgi:hypothetical protein